MENNTKAFLNMLFMGLVVLTLSACGKQAEDEKIPPRITRTNEKEFVIHVSGVNSFSCQFDATGKSLDDFIDESDEIVKEIRDHPAPNAE